MLFERNTIQSKFLKALYEKHTLIVQERKLENYIMQKHLPVYDDQE